VGFGGEDVELRLYTGVDAGRRIYGKVHDLFNDITNE